MASNYTQQIATPQLGDTFATDMKNLCSTIDNNFTILSNLVNAKIGTATPFVAHVEEIVTLDDETGKYAFTNTTDESNGKRIYKAIFDVDATSEGETTLQRRLKLMYTFGAKSITWSAFKVTTSDEQSKYVDVVMASPCVFVAEDEDTESGIKTRYTRFIIASLDEDVEYSEDSTPNEGANTFVTFVAYSSIPEINYDSEKMTYCWFINGKSTGIDCRGLKGDAGENGLFYAAKRKTAGTMLSNFEWYNSVESDPVSAETFFNDENPVYAGVMFLANEISDDDAQFGVYRVMIIDNDDVTHSQCRQLCVIPTDFNATNFETLMVEVGKNKGLYVVDADNNEVRHTIKSDTTGTLTITPDGETGTNEYKLDLTGYDTTDIAHANIEKATISDCDVLNASSGSVALDATKTTIDGTTGSTYLNDVVVPVGARLDYMGNVSSGNEIADVSLVISPEKYVYNPIGNGKTNYSENNAKHNAKMMLNDSFEMNEKYVPSVPFENEIDFNGLSTSTCNKAYYISFVGNESNVDFTEIDSNDFDLTKLYLGVDDHTSQWSTENFESNIKSMFENPLQSMSLDNNTNIHTFEINGSEMYDYEHKWTNRNFLRMIYDDVDNGLYLTGDSVGSFYFSANTGAIIPVTESMYKYITNNAQKLFGVSGSNVSKTGTDGTTISGIVIYKTKNDCPYDIVLLPNFDLTYNNLSQTTEKYGAMGTMKGTTDDKIGWANVIVFQLKSGSTISPYLTSYKNKFGDDGTTSAHSTSNMDLSTGIDVNLILGENKSLTIHETCHFKTTGTLYYHNYSRCGTFDYIKQIDGVNVNNSYIPTYDADEPAYETMKIMRYK